MHDAQGYEVYDEDEDHEYEQTDEEEDMIREAAMAKRTAMGLKLRLLTPDGETTLYPKDHLTKTKWIAAATAKGYTILEQ